MCCRRRGEAKILFVSMSYLIASFAFSFLLVKNAYRPLFLFVSICPAIGFCAQQLEYNIESGLCELLNRAASLMFCAGATVFMWRLSTMAGIFNLLLIVAIVVLTVITKNDIFYRNFVTIIIGEIIATYVIAGCFGYLDGIEWFVSIETGLIALVVFILICNDDLE